MWEEVKKKKERSLRKHSKTYPALFSKIIADSDEIERGRDENNGIGALYGRLEDLGE
jgi:hypothetical protein